MKTVGPMLVQTRINGHLMELVMKDRVVFITRTMRSTVL